MESEMADRNLTIIEEFRSNEGKVGGFFDGATMLLVHTVGRRTRKEYVNPLVYVPDGDDRWVVIASKGGAPEDPDWLRNVEANPEVTIEVGTETIPVRARIVREGPERDGLYARAVARRPGFAEYEVKAKGFRTIPAVVLERRDG
jgi:deazaflavin-dependent oxidoreductase (nitroreductase family)